MQNTTQRENSFSFVLTILLVWGALYSSPLLALCSYSTSDSKNAQASSCEGAGKTWNCSYDYCFDETRQS